MTIRPDSRIPLLQEPDRRIERERPIMRFKYVEKRLSTARSLSTTATDSARMGLIRRSGTSPELAVRRMACGLGFRYRLDNRDLAGSPDLANRAQRWAIFVHGCFWHGHLRCNRRSIPKRNRAFWVAKFRANRDRDRRVTRRLNRLGYRVIVIWECQVADEKELLKRLRRIRKSRSAAR
jgi:DNA mismatch endonuclease (patch repair protein)